MKPILIHACPSEIRENIKIIHPMIMENLDIDKEDQFKALLFTHEIVRTW